MSEHTNEHSAWLELALAGETLASSRRSALESCDECSVHLRGLESLAACLNALSAEDREILESARDVGDAPGLVEVRALSAQIRARASHHRSPPDARRLRFRSWAWLAAALVVAFVGWRVLIPDGAVEPRNDTLLGHDALELVAPVGVVGQYSRFTWNAHLPPGGWFLLIVRKTPPAATIDEPPLFERRTQEPTFAVAPELTSAWPDRIEWEVRVYEPGPRLVGSASRSASRSP